MPLIPCSDCGREISDAAAQCVGCGRPVSQGESAQPTAYPARDNNSNGRSLLARTGKAWTCDRCGGHEFKACRLLYEEGRNRSTNVTKGIGVGLGASGLAVGAGGARTESYGSSELARRLAPPQRETFRTSKAFVAPLVALLAGGALGYAGWALFGLVGTVAGALVGFVVGVAVSPSDEDGNKAYRRALQQWEQSYLCMRCSAMAILQPDGNLYSVEEFAEVDQLIRQGRKIEAVNALRQITGKDLVEAIAAVEDRARKIG